MPNESFGQPGWHSWPVPKGVEAVEIELTGAGSGGRAAGRVTGRINVNDEQVLKILIGEAGKVVAGHNGGAQTQGGGGAGGDGSGNDGGNSGGGGSFIRRNATDGTLICAAGGAGGNSGDGGDGGRGGPASGESGARGNSGSNATGNATGGTQSQAGNGGTSSSGTNFAGQDGEPGNGGRGGKGGQAPNDTHGGGGGGGGYRAGGGGQASNKGISPGGGGGGGSNYVGGLIGGQIGLVGAGGLGDGSVTITWVNPAPANQPPTSPSDMKVDDKPESDGLATKSEGRVTISAVVNDPDTGDRVRLVVWYSQTKEFSHHQVETSDLVKRGERAEVVLRDLKGDTRYYIRAWARDEHDLLSVNYNSTNFFTNRPPAGPTLVAPADNAQFPNLASLTFDWTVNDPDPNDPQSGFELRWRTAPTSSKQAGDWHVVERHSDPSTSYVTDPFTFRSSTFYDWSVKTKDAQGHFGEWAVSHSFYVTGVSAPPILKSPINGVGQDASEPIVLKWRFLDPLPGESQTKADIRYRIVGAGDATWILVLGDTTTPGGARAWTLPPGALAFPGYHYEWQARTYNEGSPFIASDWSDSGTFWTTGTPGHRAAPIIPSGDTTVQGSLGCGAYRVFLYDRGGEVLRGEIDPIAALSFKRLRDDISNCVVSTNGFSDDCGQLLKTARSWIHEIVVFRDGVRVWEGPITRITYTKDAVEFEAKDVMAYVYRRIMRQGYNDAYRIVDGQQVGLISVVTRAAEIIVNALAPSDPNILPYLTAITTADDAKESRVVPDYSRTAWEDVDDLAATAGLDYTVVGRRIILWDTHVPIGRLPEMRDGDFNDPPVVTEYGMQLTNYSAVTNNSGVWGAARPKDENENGEFYGPIEMLASAYEQTDGGKAETLTPAAREKLQESFRSQAKRNIAGRWPTPLVVRVPDNSALSPEAGIGFDQLVPGVWIPLRSVGTLRSVAQWQKLDSVTVTFGPSGEKIQVVLSPAPHGGQDVDLSPDEGEVQ